MSQPSRQSFSHLLQGSWEATQDERPRFYLFVVLFILAYSLSLLEPWAIAYTLDAFTQYGLTDEGFRIGAMGMVAYIVLRLVYSFFHHLARYVQNRVAYSARMFTLSRVFDALLRFPLRWHISHHSGETLSKLHRSAGAIDNMIGTFVWQFIEGSVKVIFAGIAIFTLDFWVATNVLAMSALTIILMIVFNRELTNRIRKNNTFGNKLNRIVVDYLVNVVTVKTLSVEESARRHLREQRNEGLVLSQRISKFMELKWGATGVGYAFVIGTSLMIYFYQRVGSGEAFLVGPVYVLISYLDRIFQAIGSFTGYYSGLTEAATAYEDATDVLQNSSKLPVRTDRSEALRTGWNTASLRELHFSYIPGENLGLNNVRFDFRRGEKIALVGQSGSGKSTLLKILAGLIEPDSYALSTDIQPSLGLDTFVQTCLLIPQEPEIFSETVIYNLTMGEEFDPREVSFFVSLCKLDLLLGKLSNGWDTNLEEKGLNLSVGEKQRLALARGLLRASRKEVILLDEPTSSLDPKTEKEIFLGLLYHFANRTVISSCHRLNLIPLFDKIVFMSQSAILEVGSFGELIDKRGYFYRAWDDYERNIKGGGQGQEEVPAA
ncbi:MAG: ABC transporter ATP-binding protein [Deltaproteobacteria bacterium]|nr:ABC transporter ATP-binding protein [Deltaproteobacteria bacterium]